MGIFKKSTSITELVDKFNKLSDEEKENFLKLAGVGPEESTEASAEHSNDANEEVEEEKQPEEDASEEEETVETDEKTEEEASEEVAEEESGEEAPAAEEEKQPTAAAEVDVDALIARLDAMEERFNSLLESVNSLLDATDEKPFGGVPPQPPAGENDGLSEDDRIMNAYMSKQTYRR